jgi:hypothetical protein
VLHSPNSRNGRVRIKIPWKVAFDSQLILQAEAGIGNAPAGAKDNIGCKSANRCIAAWSVLALRPSDRSRNAEGTTHFEHAYA